MTNEEMTNRQMGKSANGQISKSANQQIANWQITNRQSGKWGVTDEQ
jgi:hypothetical protein